MTKTTVITVSSRHEQLGSYGGVAMSRRFYKLCESVFGWFVFRLFQRLLRVER